MHLRHVLFTCSSVSGRFGCFQLFTAMNESTVNPCANPPEAGLWPRMGAPVLIHFLRSSYTIFHNSYTISHPTDSAQGPQFLYILLNASFFRVAILMGARWYLIGVRRFFKDPKRSCIFSVIVRPGEQPHSSPRPSAGPDAACTSHTDASEPKG